MNNKKRISITIFLFAFMLLPFTNAVSAADEEHYMKVVRDSEFYATNADDDSTTTSPIPAGTNVKLLAEGADKTKVDWNGQQGWVPSADLTAVSNWDVYPQATRFETTVDAAIYKKTNGKLTKFARALKGETFLKTGEEAGYVTINFSGQPAYILKAETTPVTTTSLPGGVQSGTPYKNKAITKKVTDLFYSKDNVLTSMAKIQSNEMITFTATYRDYYITDIGGRNAYVKKSDVTLFSGNYVNPFTAYSYEQMTADLKKFVQWYPGIASLEVIGKSVDGRNLYALKLGTGKEEIMINASHHAREHITTNLTMEMIDQYAYAYETNGKIDGYSARQILNRTSIYFVPMVNPDGVALVQKGASSAKNKAAALKINGNKTSFAAWKANVRGVDLNRQYPAKWPTICCNPGKPSPQNYKGPKPLSEPEAKALYDFTLNHHFKTTVSYHSSGQIVFWHFGQTGALKTRDYNLAVKVNKKTGYRLVSPQPNPSGGGYKDWFVQSQKKPGFTIEVAPYVGNGPVPISYFSSIWKQNNLIGLMLANETIK
ncbi:M14 family metallopeptidase [Bacillus sp. FJAT-27231]|uniref:M14 family metallopeptidase n=1 Tax=Bacillus sp. FJAT-27231 TaxID=1679168 RepID=UPI00069CDA5D|nr:M14 family metallocarboxypeptidase [Bacillus sp. FJAT-27231]